MDPFSSPEGSWEEDYMVRKVLLPGQGPSGLATSLIYSCMPSLIIRLDLLGSKVHFIFAFLFHGRTKRLCVDPTVGLGARQGRINFWYHGPCLSVKIKFTNQ